MEFYLHFNLDMDRSPGFGPYTSNFYADRSRHFALFRLGFPSAADLKVLNLATYIRSPDHSTKGTLSHIDVL